MARTLRRTVFVDHPDTHKSTMILGGTVPQDWAVPLITNPAAWAPEADPAVAAEADPAAGGYAPFSELGSKPYNTIAEIQRWVGDDKERAVDALTYETDPDDPRPDSGQNRSTFLPWLAAVIG